MGFPDDACKSHNNLRSKHGVSNLKLNKEIVATAQRWADHLASTGTFMHSQDRQFKSEKMGENIAMKWTSTGEDFTGQQVTDQWYSEIEKYDFNRNSGAGTGHFTQVVWKDSREFGIGKAKGRDGKWIVVANYYPAGNFLGRFADNVFPIGGSSKSGSSASGGGLFGLFGKKEKEPEPTSQVRSYSSDRPSGELSSGGGGGGGRSVSTNTRTERVTEDRGQGMKTYTKTTVTETVTDSNGKKTVNTKVTETTGDAGASGSGKDDKKEKKEKEKKPQKMKDFIDDCIKSHNKYRKTHAKVGDLKHNKELSVLAQRWADHLGATNVLKHSNDTYKGEPVGENVATKWSSAGADYTGQEVAEQWYSELPKYSFARATFTPGTGHFTQVVWKGSKEIGVGKCVGSDGRVFVVCNYFPAGNVVGQFGDNVFAAK